MKVSGVDGEEQKQQLDSLGPVFCVGMRHSLVVRLGLFLWVVETIVEF